jgi:hypothetical protein
MPQETEPNLVQNTKQLIGKRVFNQYRSFWRVLTQNTLYTAASLSTTI